jgi:hypothetical protein
VWLLEVNNNPYLGIPNAFIRELLPKMVDELFEIVLDPLFPPEQYSLVEEKRFELIFRDASLFRLQPVRVNSSSNDNKVHPHRKSSYSRTKPATTEKINLKVELSDLRSPKPVYSTPAETVKYLLENYCFNDVDPFMIPVSLMLSSSSLSEEQSLEANLKKLRLVTETRIARILLEPRLYELCANIIGQ